MDVGTLVDLVLVVLALEAFVLAWLSRRQSPQRPRLMALWPNFGAGLCLVLAVRSVAERDSAMALGGFLALAGVCHGIDLLSRLKR